MCSDFSPSHSYGAALCEMQTEAAVHTINLQAHLSHFGCHRDGVYKEDQAQTQRFEGKEDDFL